MKGNLVYLYAALRALAGWKHARFRVTVDGDTYEVVGYSVAIGNSKAYGGGMFVFPHAKLDDGLLDVVTVARARQAPLARGRAEGLQGDARRQPVWAVREGQGGARWWRTGPSPCTRTATRSPSSHSR